jgi:cytochrome c-type biogenesis protein
MDQYLEAFSLGNAAILGNVCMLPLYPGLFVLFANSQGRTRGLRWMGLVVLAGIITMMVAIGFVFHQLQRSVADVLDWLLPVMYLAVLVLGVAMLLDKNPFARLSTTQVPILRNPVASAYVYGMLLAPMTLPCTGPLIVSAFVIGGVSGTGALAESLLYFVWFAIGFGWPLVVLPLMAAPAQRSVTRWLTRHHRAISIVSGVLLIGIALFGWWNDVRPNW